MSKVKTSALTGTALDWAAAKCEDLHTGIDGFWSTAVLEREENPFKYSTDWSLGGPSIAREKLCVGHKHQADPEYCPVNDPATNCWARTTAGGYLSYGPTPLIAAMRCLVASKLGDEVEVPDGL